MSNCWNWLPGQASEKPQFHLVPSCKTGLFAMSPSLTRVLGELLHQSEVSPDIALAGIRRHLSSSTKVKKDRLVW